MSQEMKIGGKYNWKGQPERLIYIGYNFSGNGYWHQFEKVGEPGKVWCEVLAGELISFEETVPKPVAAQEPIAWMHGTAGRFEVIHAEVKKLWERVGQPAQFAKEVVSCKVENYTIPLYSHAAQCARCEELEDAAPIVRDLMVRSVEQTDKITEQAAEIERLREDRDSHQRLCFALQGRIDTQAERISELESALEWHAIDYAPHNQRVLVKSASGEIYAAHWVQHPGTGDEAWCVSEAEDGTQHLIRPVEWRAIAPSDGGRAA